MLPLRLLLRRKPAGAFAALNGRFKFLAGAVLLLARSADAQPKTEAPQIEETSAKLLGEIILGSRPQVLASKGDVVLLAEGDALEIVDNSDPSRPQRTSALRVGVGAIQDVQIAGSVAYFIGSTYESSSQYVAIGAVDFSDLFRPKILASDDLGQLGVTFGTEMRVSDGILMLQTAYRLQTDNTLYDISDPLHPRLIEISEDRSPSLYVPSLWPLSEGRVCSLAAVEDVWAVETWDRTPSGPYQLRHQIELPEMNSQLEVYEASFGADGELACVAVGGRARLIEIPANAPAKLAAEIRIDGTLLYVAVAGRRVLLATDERGLTLWDASDADRPVKLYETDHHSTTSEDLGLPPLLQISSSDEVKKLLDLRRDSKPLPVSARNGEDLLSGCSLGPDTFAYFQENGRVAIAARTPDRYVDLSSTPTRWNIDEDDLKYRERRIRYYDRRASVISVPDETGFVNLDISDLERPREVGRYDPLGAAHVVIVGDTAYVAGDKRLSVIDLADPGNPRPRGGSELSSPSLGIAACAGAICVGQSQGLSVFSAENPDAPELLSRIVWQSGPGPFAAEDSTLYVADGATGLISYSLADPSRPKEFAREESLGKLDRISCSFPWLVAESRDYTWIIRVGESEDVPGGGLRVVRRLDREGAAALYFDGRSLLVEGFNGYRSMRDFAVYDLDSKGWIFPVGTADEKLSADEDTAAFVAASAFLGNSGVIAWELESRRSRNSDVIEVFDLAQLPRLTPIKRIKGVDAGSKLAFADSKVYLYDSSSIRTYAW